MLRVSTQRQPIFPRNILTCVVCAYRGHEAGPSNTIRLGMSQILPGGHTSLSASPIEKIYFVLDGELTIETPDGETTLYPNDSCRIAPNEARALKNNTNKTVTTVLAMPLTKT